METATATLGKVEEKTRRPSRWWGRSVLITGATGFLGNALTYRLAREGARVSVINRDPYDPGLPYFAEGTSELVDTVITGDLRDYRVCERAMVETNPDVVFHLAAVSQVGWCRRMPLQAIETHVLGTANLLEACRVATGGDPPAIVVASTDKVYGKHPPSDMPLTDASTLLPEHPYDVSKASADLVAQSYGTYYGLPVAVTRCGNIYGPGDIGWDRLIPGTLRSLLLDQAPVLRSNGAQVREYNYIGDIVAAYLALADGIQTLVAPPGSVWTISNGAAFPVMDVVRRCMDTVRIMYALEPSEPVVQDRANDETPILTLNADRFAQAFNWQPADKDLEWLPETAAWVKHWLVAKGCLP
jgi:CDP-glucose 4,6-dehydratase